MIDAFARAHRAGQQHFNDGDFEQAFAGLAPDVEWHLLPNLFETGVLHGRDEAVRYFRGIREGTSWAVEAQEFIDAGSGRVIVHQRGTAVGRTTNISGAVDFFQLWTLREDGLVGQIREYETRDEVLAAAAAEATNR